MCSLSSKRVCCDFQARQCTRVRLKFYGKFGDIKLDVAYGPVVYGLAVGKADEVIISGGQFGYSSIDIIRKNAHEVSLVN